VNPAIHDDSHKSTLNSRKPLRYFVAMRSDMNTLNTSNRTEHVVTVALMTNFSTETTISETMTIGSVSKTSRSVSAHINLTLKAIYSEAKSTVRNAMTNLKGAMTIVCASLMIIIVLLTRINASGNSLAINGARLRAILMIVMTMTIMIERKTVIKTGLMIIRNKVASSRPW
jgi:hypothetical protein